MPTKKNPLAQANKARAAKAKAREKVVRSGLSKLRKAGLWKGKESARSVKLTSYHSRLVNQFADVISGKAVAVKADVNTEIAFRGSGGRGAHGRVIVEKQSPGERVRFNKRTGTVEGRRYAYGNEIVRRVFFQKVFDPKKLPKPKKNQRFYYQARFVKGETPRFEDLKSFLQYMAEYANAKSGNKAIVEKFNSFYASHVNIEEIVGEIRPGDEDKYPSLEDAYGEFE